MRYVRFALRRKDGQSRLVFGSAAWPTALAWSVSKACVCPRFVFGSQLKGQVGVFHSFSPSSLAIISFIIMTIITMSPVMAMVPGLPRLGLLIHGENSVLHTQLEIPDSGVNSFKISTVVCSQNL